MPGPLLHHSEATLRKDMTVENRGLSEYDKGYLKARYSLGSWLSFVCPALATRKKERKWKEAFYRVVKVSPIMQTNVHDRAGRADREDLHNKHDADDTAAAEHHDAAGYRGPSSYVFKKMDNEHQWPILEVQYMECDSDVISKAQFLAKEGIEQIAKDGEVAALKLSIRMHAILGPKRVALVIVAPHFFLDGQGLGTVFTKTVAYARVPKILWPLLDRMSHEDVPTFYEMAMKKDIDALRKYVNVLPEQHNPIDEHPYGNQEDAFMFIDYDSTADGATNKLSGFKDHLIDIPSRSMKKWRCELRKSGATVSTAFCALPIKILSILLDKASLNEENKPLVTTIPTDGRWLGEWNGSRGPNNSKGMLPVIGNFTFSTHVFVPAEMARRSSLEEIAKHQRAAVTKLEKDIDFRAFYVMSGPSSPNVIFVGASSLIVPSITSVLGFRNVETNAIIDFGPAPHVWFYILTLNKVATKVLIDIKLPITGLDKTAIKAAIQEAVKDTALSPLFETILW